MELKKFFAIVYSLVVISMFSIKFQACLKFHLKKTLTWIFRCKLRKIFGKICFRTPMND